MIDPWDYLRTQPPGSSVAAITNGVASMLVREDRKGLKSYPPKCSVEWRLGVRQVSRVWLGIWMVRLAKKDSGTFEGWINVFDPYGQALAFALRDAPHLDVHIHTDRVMPERSLRTDNTLREAAALLLWHADNDGHWSAEEFMAARAAVEREQPTVRDLWRSLK